MSSGVVIVACQGQRLRPLFSKSMCRRQHAALAAMWQQLWAAWQRSNLLHMQGVCMCVILVGQRGTSACAACSIACVCVCERVCGTGNFRDRAHAASRRRTCTVYACRNSQACAANDAATDGTSAAAPATQCAAGSAPAMMQALRGTRCACTLDHQ